MKKTATSKTIKSNQRLQVPYLIRPNAPRLVLRQINSCRLPPHSARGASPPSVLVSLAEHPPSLGENFSPKPPLVHRLYKNLFDGVLGRRRFSPQK